MANVEILNQENFAAFGEVIETGEHCRHFGINYGYTERYHDLADIDTSANGGRAIVNIFRSKPLPMPLELKIMERHPLSSQAFIPLGNQPYLVAVAPAGDFDPDAVRLFLASADQGVNYRRGTWHHFCLALQAVSEFLVIDRGGDGDNCDEVELKQAITVSQEDLPLS